MGKQVRMADIAQKLGISTVSVSKALAGKPGVSEEMRAKVVALSQEMGYVVPRPAAESAEGNLGVLVADRFFADNAFYTSLYRSLVLTGGSAGLSCMMEIVSPQDEENVVLPALVAGRKVDAVLFMGEMNPAYIQAVADSGLPFILLDFHVPGKHWDCVLGDNADGEFALTQHLLENGCRKIGFVGSIWATSSIMDRYLGFQKAMRMAGLVPREEWLLEDRGKDGKFIPIRLPEDMPEAFLCSCDEVAYLLVEALKQQGYQVPDDVAVCGYDDYRFSTLCQPPLTTYRVDIQRMAEIAVDMIEEKLRQTETLPVGRIVLGNLVVRESSIKTNVRLFRHGN